MSAEAASAHADHHHDVPADGAPERFLQHHFQDLNVQAQAARFGMWLFLSTEILLFGGLFIGYSLYRQVYHEGFHEAAHQLKAWAGMADTIILITSSITMAVAIDFAGRMKPKVATFFIAVTIFFGLSFLAFHGWEYMNDIREGNIPGKLFHNQEVTAHGASMFFTLYFLMTGLHSLHVLIGACILGYLGVRTWRGDFSPRYMNPLENGGLYWHLIDLIWIFLFPLLYLIA
jgi:cytochrome c oxidase subunit 3